MINLRRLRLLSVLLVLVAVAVIALPGSITARGPALSRITVQHLSQSVAARYYTANPAQAPDQLQARFAELQRISSAKQVAVGSGRSISQSIPTPILTGDAVGLPQNEESVGACKQDMRKVLGGTNDYRGLLDPEGNFTGWHYSSTGGSSLTKEGLLPSIAGIPSGGDPVDVGGMTGIATPSECAFFAADLNFGDPSDPNPGTNGIGIYKTTPAILSSAACRDTTTLSDPDCWPTRRLVATNTANHFLDKEWMHVGVSGGQQVVWVTWTDFDNAPAGGEPFTASIMASRCTDDLITCSPAQQISGSDADVQFSDVTVGPDGRTYITWSEILGELEGTPQTFVHKLRIAPAGSTTFGPTRIIATETQPLAFGGVLQANDFRIATVLKSAVAMVGSTPRIFAIWDACSTRIFSGVVCEYPGIKLAWSDNDGASWSTSILSASGVNYFPTISADPVSGRVITAWYTNRYDAFQNAQDVEVAGFRANAPAALIARVRLTSQSNETEADPFLGGFFIGDYIEAFAYNSMLYVHFNANYRQVGVLGGLPVNQQDNFIARYP